MSSARILRWCSVSGRCVPPRRWSHGGVEGLPGGVREFVEENVRLCQPSGVHVCTGSEVEAQTLLGQLEARGQLTRLGKYPNCWLARTDRRDVARVESRTVMVSDRERDSVPVPSDGSTSQLGRWMSPPEFRTQVGRRFPGCMRGRTMYVLPFSMGPLDSPLARLGVQLTDSPYVVVSMGIMTRMGSPAMAALTPGADFIRCLHSVGRPLADPAGADPDLWPCDPELTLIGHVPDRREIISFGSGYGGNSLLGKKCLALRIASNLARQQGWLAEHMLILGVTNPEGRKTYVAAAFPSACGKTNLAMMQPALPGWKVECVGDDIAWMRFDSSGRLRAINPENGFFGVAPGTSQRTNPNAMATIARNTIFTNVGHTSDGGVYWEGIDQELPPGVTLTSWTGQPWTQGDAEPCAHPNSRFCAPARQCPSMDPAWESPEGVPIDAIIFGGRRPEGVPLVYEAFDWTHGVFIGASMRSESTAAAEHKGKQLMHDPFAMRPFLGYNFGEYLQHWLGLGLGRSLGVGGARLPRIFHVNWFRRGADGAFLWPGFGHNVRVLEWICGRVEGQAQAQASPIGLLPAPGSINLQGLSGIDMDALLALPKDFWQREAAQIAQYLNVQVNRDLPQAIAEQAAALESRVAKM